MIMSNVKSTYNFVPAPQKQKFFKPSLNNIVSHDIPFSDGESGEIETENNWCKHLFLSEKYSKKQ
jgi:hypothetical protein